MLNNSVLQNVHVYQGTSSYVAVTEFSREVVSESDKAHEVLQAAIDAQVETGGTVLIGRGVFTLHAPIQ